LAPEAGQNAATPDTYERRGRFVGGSASTLLESVARGEGIRERVVICLASAVLTDPEVKLALSLVADDRPHALADAIELARLVRERTASLMLPDTEAAVRQRPPGSGRGNYSRVRRVTR